ncbi:calcium-binding protein [Aestuariispira insulae]|uniref:Haemolysin-type calcium binding-related domain-containing protein n=1 Tax=Aestuariispira insulae TaxID=1461337 RepID=A0A3D9H2H6_9PROT|nr:calcium-binding protein [Aestuariispira insulae]RED43694.1 hypothetical protein DFP90_1215 [Aestuariispira insulae]
MSSNVSASGVSSPSWFTSASPSASSSQFGGGASALQDQPWYNELNDMITTLTNKLDQQRAGVDGGASEGSFTQSGSVGSNSWGSASGLGSSETKAPSARIVDVGDESGAVLGSRGNDEFRLTQDSNVRGTIRGGDGNDVITLEEGFKRNDQGQIVNEKTGDVVRTHGIEAVKETVNHQTELKMKDGVMNVEGQKSLDIQLDNLGGGGLYENSMMMTFKDQEGKVIKHVNMTDMDQDGMKNIKMNVPEGAVTANLVLVADGKKAGFGEGQQVQMLQDGDKTRMLNMEGQQFVGNAISSDPRDNPGGRINFLEFPNDDGSVSYNIEDQADGGDLSFNNERITLRVTGNRDIEQYSSLDGTPLSADLEQQNRAARGESNGNGNGNVGSAGAGSSEAMDKLKEMAAAQSSKLSGESFSNSGAGGSSNTLNSGNVSYASGSRAAAENSDDMITSHVQNYSMAINNGVHNFYTDAGEEGTLVTSGNRDVVHDAVGNKIIQTGAGDDTVHISNSINQTRSEMFVDGGTGDDRLNLRNVDYKSIHFDSPGDTRNGHIEFDNGSRVEFNNMRSVIMNDKTFITEEDGTSKLHFAEGEQGIFVDRANYSQEDRAITGWTQNSSGEGVRTDYDVTAHYGTSKHDYFCGAGGGGAGDDNPDYRAEFHGRGGNDFIRGSGADDKLFGDSGDDQIVGGRGDDFLRGGLGNDRLEGERGTDVVFGGLGNDTYVFNRGDGEMRSYDVGGNDTIELHGANLEELSFHRFDQNLAIKINGTSDIVSIRGYFDNSEDNGIETLKLDNQTIALNQDWVNSRLA